MVVAALALGVGAIACSSKTSSDCDDSKCAAGNKCLTLDGVTACRKTCSSNSDPANACPYGYTCVSNDPSPFCIADTTGFTTPRKGQWGTQCNPGGGIDNNPDCDITNAFWCFAQSPTDGAAYCTIYDCNTDRDCAAGFYCGAANVGPNATSTKRHLGETRNVCQKRSYCAPCVADLDCPPDNGRPQHCLPTADGSDSFCSPECTSNSTCNNEAKCSPLGSDPSIKTCYPRAGTCKGDGSFCSPCRSDADCGTDGACIKGQYTTEHFCGKKGSGACAGATTSPCPKPPAGANKHATCSTGDSPEVPPTDFCGGVYFFVDNAVGPCTATSQCPVVDNMGDHEPCIDGQCILSEDFGCYTPNRNGD